MEDRTASGTVGLLSVLVATFLVFIVTAPVASSKLESLWSSEFTLRPDTSDPTCLPSGLCFRFVDGSLEWTPTGHGIPLRMTGVDNIYEIARDVDKGALKTVLVDGAKTERAPEIQPRYESYFNWDEASREASALLRFVGAPPLGPIRLAFEQAGAVGDVRTLNIARHDVGTLAAFLMKTGHPATARLTAGVSILLLAAGTSWAEARASRRLALGSGAFAGAVTLRLAALTAAGAMASPTDYLLVVLGVLTPWLAVTSPAWRPKLEPSGPTRWPTGGMAGRIAPLWRPRRWSEGASISELGVLVLGVGVFAYLLWFGTSFRWSIFEERDFLEARRVLADRTVPLYGPELLLGGHTIGGGLYLLLAPVVALWNDPAVLLLLNRLLFVGMALALWWGTKEWVGPAGALFAVVALVASDRILALSYWPIHPNFSLFFAVVYACALLRGAVGGHRAWLIFAGGLLGVLVQLHFSYFLLVPCHVLIVLIANYDRDRWTKPLAAAAWLIPLAPFVIADAANGFPNIVQIAQRPRSHSLYPSKIFGNADLPPLALGWLRQTTGPWSGARSTLTQLCVGLGVAVGIGSAETSTGSGRGRMTPGLAAAILLAIPAFELTILGMGYNTRHTLAMVPALFILAGVGWGGAVNLLRVGAPGLAPLVALPLLVVLAARVSDSAALERIISSEGEWAVDYRSREAIATDLAARVGVSPRDYRAKTYWWWVGWSVEPAVYADVYRRVVGSAAVSQPALAADEYVLVTAAAELPPFLQRIFDDRGSHPIGGMHVHVATPKKGAPSVLPSSNADTGVRLHPFLQDVDTLRRQPPGFHRIGQAQVGGARRDLFLGTVAEGRITLLVTLEQSRIQGRGRLRWCVDSPSLNGHYQEIKTIWRPRLVLAQEAASAVELSLAGDVLGSLTYKAPRCGEGWSVRTGPWRVTLAVEGVFDQSFMPRPELLQQRWRLDFGAPLRNTSLAQRAISQWIDGRFDQQR